MLLFVYLFLSFGLLALVSLTTLGRSRRGYSGACIFGFVAAAGGFCLGSWILSLNGSLVGLVAFASDVNEVPRRKFLLGSLAATVVVYVGAIVFFAIFEERKWVRLEEQYPEESLTERLQYEKEARKFASPQLAATFVNTERLDSFESWMNQGGFFDMYRREVSLRQLHAGSVQRFIDSQGFGAGRMIIRPAPDKVELPEPEPISLPVYPETSTVGTADEETRLRRTGGQPQDIHEDSLLSFFNPRAFGYIRDRDHVVGFQPHAFTRAPSVTNKWWIDRLELVSLLKHEEPAVYLSENLPRMQDLRDAETRPLDDYEQEALAGLRRGEDIKEQSTSDRIRMLGAIRAVEQCLKCHSVERGDLLGAFSYDLRREP